MQTADRHQVQPSGLAKRVDAGRSQQPPIAEHERRDQRLGVVRSVAIVDQPATATLAQFGDRSPGRESPGVKPLHRSRTPDAAARVHATDPQPTQAVLVFIASHRDERPQSVAGPQRVDCDQRVRR